MFADANWMHFSQEEEKCHHLLVYLGFNFEIHLFRLFALDISFKTWNKFSQFAAGWYTAANASYYSFQFTTSMLQRYCCLKFLAYALSVAYFTTSWPFSPSMYLDMCGYYVYQSDMLCYDLHTSFFVSSFH